MFFLYEIKIYTDGEVWQWLIEIEHANTFNEMNIQMEMKRFHRQKV